MRRRDFVFGAVGVSIISGRQALAAEKIFRIGYLDPASKTPISEANFAEFRKALIALGYEEGKNLSLDVRWANGDANLYKSLCAELGAERVDVLVTHSTWGVSIAKHEVSAIPIVFALVQDAVGNGFVQSLAHPQGNLTGSSFFFPELMVKRLALAHEAQSIPRRRPHLP
jgi:putative tryptophan/tyrosine transport system substrate-binding protein